ncbi:MAG: translation initiation factor IF-2 subunit gamma [Nitrososphaeraceae archaeon]|nr:translation initiation factor IF-2 subunit gamma [Nitrososphaeraceae archaeon]MDW0137010.1 translation initiation factor IF-2 subunit gamma [Nitrososphaeraceae archaeon]MDW0139381.1 translation initiation factor IF-2 subunit gamma [Nitrososphaeraceae archaeon]MDW0142892.1 translation initiation factor IF-2 subunit gamma [Nitrososphaeraceae archaeon]MDW0146605.1 translation initiation factor IF-2 subunit gamma [Nitrososphaeraceae archaeon]
MHWKETLPEWYVKQYGYQPCVNIGTSGHVDHGKTTLVESITGVWTSGHSEELRRGITIKVGYADAAFYKCKNCPPPICYSTQPECKNCGQKSEFERVVSFVDSPGHESLMANMLSGAALMDGAILVTAANEKVPQPQTREHLLALQTLGIKQIVLVQNKVDLVSYEETIENYKQIKNFVKGSVADTAPIIPVSAQHKLNIDALIEAIQINIKTPERSKNSEPLMHVLRSFDINKPGLPIGEVKGGVIGGSLIQGDFETGDEIEIRPGLYDEKKGKYEPIMSKISSLGTGAGIVQVVKPGGLVALGTTLDPYIVKSDSLIGSLVGLPNSLPPDIYDVTIELNLFETAVGTQELVKVDPIKIKESLRLNIGTAATLGTVTHVKDHTVEIKLKKPVCMVSNNRVAISRRIADRWRLIGSGIAS